MFLQPLLTSASRGRALGLAALVGLCATSVATAPAQASTAAAPAGEAVIASASGTTIDTTSGSRVTVGRTEGRSASTTASASGALTLNSPDPTTTTKAPTPKTSADSQIGGSSLESPIVSSSARQAPSAPRAALAQIQSSGPIVASSGTAAVTRHSTRTRSRQASAGSYATRRPAYSRTPIAASSTVQINVPGVHVFISQTSARRPSANTHTSPPARNFARATMKGAGFAGLLPTDPRPVPAPSGPANTTLFGSASGSVGGSLLLGIDALLAFGTLLAGVAWRRRSWDLPVLPRQSALLSLALDRPG
ncbi:MAG TPA: hypothetical protein VIJ51_01220 [Solirubrobacteraceae bacterium]